MKEIGSWRSWRPLGSANALQSMRQYCLYMTCYAFLIFISSVTSRWVTQQRKPLPTYFVKSNEPYYR